jgi:hypothetical protein
MLFGKKCQLSYHSPSIGSIVWMVTVQPARGVNARQETYNNRQFPKIDDI